MSEEELDDELMFTCIKALENENKILRKQVRFLQKTIKLLLKKLKMCGYGSNEKEIIKEVEKC